MAQIEIDIEAERGPEAEGMSDAQFVAMLDSQISAAQEGDEESSNREMALDYFNGETPDLVTPHPDDSQVVSTDVADTVTFLVANQERVFLGTDQVGIYEPAPEPGREYASPEELQAALAQAKTSAAKATDYVNHRLRKCDGHTVIHGGLHNAFLHGLGILKFWWDAMPDWKVEAYTGLTDDEFAYKTQGIDDGSVEILQHSEMQDPSFNPLLAQLDVAPLTGEPALDPETGAPPQPAAPMLHDVRLRRRIRPGKICVKVVPNEDFGMDRAATGVNEDECRFFFHRDRPTRASLIERGIDKDKVMALAAVSGGSIEQDIRDRNRAAREEAPDDLTERVEVYECYVYADRDGDGVPEWRHVLLGGTAGGGDDDSGEGLGASDRILSDEEWGEEMVPFAALVADPVPHQVRGRGAYDKAGPVQRVKTVLLRAVLDNIYRTVRPNRVVNTELIDNPEALYDGLGIGEYLHAKGDPRNAVADLAMPFFAKEAFPVIEYIDQAGSRRTGFSDSAMGLNPDVLQDQTAAAVNQAAGAANILNEYYTNNLKVGLERLFRGLYLLIKRHQEWAETISLRGDWVVMDPREWGEDVEVSINVGLGTGSRDKDMAVLGSMLMEQKQLVQAMGPRNPLCGLRQVNATQRKMAELSGIKAVDVFFPEYTPDVDKWLEQQEQAKSQGQMDPKALEVQMKAQAEQAKLQMEHQFRMQQLAQEHALEMEKLRLEDARKREQLKAEAQMKAEQIVVEARLKAGAAAMDAHMRGKQAASQMSSRVEFGGEVG